MATLDELREALVDGRTTVSRAIRMVKGVLAA
jgi:hypothetical protein